MRIKVDENLAAVHRRILEEAGHDVTDVYDENLRGADDADLWSRVCEETRFLVTLDHDFSDVREFQPGTHAGILNYSERLIPAEMSSPPSFAAFSMRLTWTASQAVCPSRMKCGRE